MAMTQFEKAVIKELQGIKKELHELNKKQPEQQPEQGQVDGIAIDMGDLINRSIRSGERETFYR